MAPLFPQSSHMIEASVKNPISYHPLNVPTSVVSSCFTPYIQTWFLGLASRERGKGIDEQYGDIKKRHPNIPTRAAVAGWWRRNGGASPGLWSVNSPLKLDGAWYTKSGVVDG